MEQTARLSRACWLSPDATVEAFWLKQLSGGKRGELQGLRREAVSWQTWDRACGLAGLGDEVTPHVLEHTCITWLLQNRVPIWEVAGFVGTSEKVIRDTYGHHSPDHLNAARTGFSGRSLGRGK